MTDHLSRRTMLRVTAAGAAAFAASLAGCSSTSRAGASSTLSTGDSPSPLMTPTPTSTAGSVVGGAGGQAAGSRVLLAYFSRPGENYFDGGRRTLDVGNTEVLAELIAARIPCEVYRIREADPYPAGYDATVERNESEQQADARPAIADPLPDLSAYNTVLLGSPVWNVRAPMIMSTFTDGVDLTGKTILPFVTYAVSRMAGIDQDYRDAIPGAQVGAGLAVRGENTADADADIDQWLTAAGLLA